MAKLLLLLLVFGLGACGPMGRFPGGPLRGEVVEGPVESWAFAEDHKLIELETRPIFPHSVTTVCFIHEGQLYIPSRNPRGKRWPRYVAEDKRVRLRIGEKIYLGNALRVTNPWESDSLYEALGRKYARLHTADKAQRPELWFYRIESR